MNTVDSAGLGLRILELLRLKPEAVLEVSVLKSGAYSSKDRRIDLNCQISST